MFRNRKSPLTTNNSKKEENMEEVWFFFKLIETLLGSTCMIFHIQGFLDDRQPLPHQMYFCGTFFGFTIIAIFGNIGISLGSRPSMLIEAIVSGVASLFFILSSIFSMYHAEKDFHLMYLSDYEESIHPFFAISKKQSITALCCGLFYMLHTVFAVDAILITDEIQFDEQGAQAENIAKADIECYQPIKLYICGKELNDILEKQEWFLRITGQDVRNARNGKIQKIMKDLKYVRHDNII
ncbi:uncharacterized protein LOC129910412 [Episyrphus balteatus]|uniref:uncharacterized protein LOC129910412 n=1 Tax=Episyrphus balteatus TaxID=286459 RepID=UPI002485D5AC|nr:uncharacterized protein LOC129910412 [Episyrphus balteatus]